MVNTWSLSHGRLIGLDLTCHGSVLCRPSGRAARAVPTPGGPGRSGALSRRLPIAVERAERSDREGYFALIGDIVGSRALENRAAVQRRLRDLIEEVGEDAGTEALAAPLKLTTGDEVQALVAEPGAVVPIVVHFADRLHPVRMSWGLGRGALTTDLDRDVSVLDGPCFHHARAALEEATREDAWLRAHGIRQPQERVLNALFGLMGAIRGRWTDVQAQYVSAARGRLQKHVARELGVSEPAVSKALAAARFSAVEEGEEAAEALLRWLGRSAGGAADPEVAAPPPSAEEGP